MRHQTGRHALHRVGEPQLLLDHYQIMWSALKRRYNIDRNSTTSRVSCARRAVAHALVVLVVLLPVLPVSAALLVRLPRRRRLRHVHAEQHRLRRKHRVGLILSLTIVAHRLSAWRRRLASTANVKFCNFILNNLARRNPLVSAQIFAVHLCIICAITTSRARVL